MSKNEKPKILLGKLFIFKRSLKKRYYTLAFLSYENRKLYCLFNYKHTASFVTWYAFKEHGERPSVLHDHWSGINHKVGNDNEYFVLPPYSFAILESVKE